ncbi:MAG: hypothetical protein M3454_15740 [Actinomycetota bacterium]|nr:hypothetical protein [Actinomycetota bacterium]
MRNSDQRGQALIESLLLGMLLLVPLIWALGVLSDLHRSALVTAAAAREAGFQAATASTEALAGAAIDAAVARALVDGGIDLASARVSWSAVPRLERGAAVEVEVSYPVTVLQAPFLGRIAGPSIWVTSRHVARVDPYRSL